LYPDELNLTTVPALKRWLDSPLVGGVSSVVPALGGLGTGYTSTPSVAVSDALGSGSGAAVTAIRVGTQITSYVVTAMGQNYVLPQIVVSGGGGTGASANAFIGSDAALARLITAVSSGIVSLLSIDTIFDSGSNIVEVRNGNGQSSMELDVSPIISISAMSIGNTAVVASSDGIATGYQFGTRPSDSNVVYLIGNSFVRGTRNISITYRGGEVLGSLFQQELEQWCLSTCALWWKRRPHVAEMSINVPQVGNLTFSQADYPKEVWTGIKQHQRVMSYD
jgi:hypothetical protein